jgi:hypothetical protein
LVEGFSATQSGMIIRELGIHINPNDKLFGTLFIGRIIYIYAAHGTVWLFFEDVWKDVMKAPKR